MQSGRAACENDNSIRGLLVKGLRVCANSQLDLNQKTTLC